MMSSRLDHTSRALSFLIPHVLFSSVIGNLIKRVRWESSGCQWSHRRSQSGMKDTRYRLLLGDPPVASPQIVGWRVVFSVAKAQWHDDAQAQMTFCKLVPHECASTQFVIVTERTRDRLRFKDCMHFLYGIPINHIVFNDFKFHYLSKIHAIQ